MWTSERPHGPFFWSNVLNNFDEGGVIFVYRETLHFVLEPVAAFFSATGARKAALKKQCTGDQSRIRTSGIPLMSDTRWGTRATTMCAFVAKFGTVHSTLRTLETEHTSISGKSCNVWQSVEYFQTIITAVITNYVLGFMQPLTKQLQATYLDTVSAYQEARNVRDVIAQQRCEQAVWGHRQILDLTNFEILATALDPHLRRRTTNWRRLWNLGFDSLLL